MPNYEDQAKIFEKMSGYEIPPSFLKFLREHGTGAIPDPSVFENCCEIDIFLNFRFDPDGMKQGASIREKYETLVNENHISKNLMPFAVAEGGHTAFLLVLSGSQTGAILWTHDTDLLLPDDYNSNFFDQGAFAGAFISESMQDFVSKLESTD